MSENDESVRVVARLARVFETELGEHGMSLPQFRLLAFLAEGESAASQLADWLAVSRPSITSLVSGVVEHGWVARHHCDSDRRRVLHQLTPAGQRQLSEVAGRLAATLADIFDHLDPDEQARARDGLDLLALGMRRQREAVVNA